MAGVMPVDRQRRLTLLLLSCRCCRLAARLVDVWFALSISSNPRQRGSRTYSNGDSGRHDAHNSRRATVRQRLPESIINHADTRHVTARAHIRRGEDAVGREARVGCGRMWARCGKRGGVGFVVLGDDGSLALGR